MPLRLTHVRLLVDDFERAFRFYRDVVGLTPAFGGEDETYADFVAGDAVLALFARSGMGGVTPLRPPGDGSMVVFAVDGVDDVAGRLRAGGAEVVSDPHDEPDWGIRVAHFRDPEGNLVEINQRL